MQNDNHNLITNPPTTSGDDGDTNKETALPPVTPNEDVGDTKENSVPQVVTPKNNVGDTEDTKQKLGDTNGPTNLAHRQDVTAAIKNNIDYTVSVADAQTRYAKAHRKVPSNNKLQLLCRQGIIVALKVPVTYEDGTHALPWMMNEQSLDGQIEKEALIVFDREISTNKNNSVTPNEDVGDTKDQSVSQVVPPDNNIGATGDTNQTSGDTKPEVEISKIHQTITLQELLLENAHLEGRLEEIIEAKDAVITSKNETITKIETAKEFVEEELRDRRELSRDVAKLANRLLDTVDKQTFRDALKAKEGPETLKPGKDHNSRPTTILNQEEENAGVQ